MKVCLDPGHYKGYNKGYYRDYAEGTAMFDYAQRLAEKLKAVGVDVVMTKKTVDENPSLTARGKKAKGCDLFVSLHSNGVDNPNAYGVTVFYSIKRNEDKPYATDWCDRLANLICGGTRPRGAYTRKGGGDWDYYTVIQYAVAVKCPHVFLIEHGFHTNQKECRWLMNVGNMDRMADLECSIICDILRIPVEPVIILGHKVCRIDGMPVRAEPSGKGKKVDELAKYSVVSVAGVASNGWIKVIQPGKRAGWCNYQRFDDLPKNPLMKVRTITPEDTLNVRVSPDYMSEKICVIPDGQEIPVFGQHDNGWYLIQFRNDVGWVNGRYCEVL